MWHEILHILKLTIEVCGFAGGSIACWMLAELSEEDMNKNQKISQ